MNPPGKPSSMADVMRRAITSALAEVHTAMPGKIVRYDSAKQQAEVQPLLKTVHYDEDDNRQVESLPVIPGVPVAFPGGGGTYITFPIQEGDTGTIIFSEQSLDRWLQKGDDNGQLEFRFNLTDAIFIPGLRPFSAALKNAPTNRMTIGYNEGTRIHIENGRINIGTDATGDLEKTALAETLKQFLTSFKTWADGHVHVVAGTAPPPAGAFTTTSAQPSSASPAIPTIESSTVYVKK